MKKRKPNTMGKLGVRPKSYVIAVAYKAFWPIGEWVDYNYQSFAQAAAHVSWLLRQLKGQNGKNCERKNVVLEFVFSERLRSKKLDNKLPPVKTFLPPGRRMRPKGGVVRPAGT